MLIVPAPGVLIRPDKVSCGMMGGRERDRVGEELAAGEAAVVADAAAGDDVTVVAVVTAVVVVGTFLN